jgi:hypothetical protein
MNAKIVMDAKAVITSPQPSHHPITSYHLAGVTTAGQRSCTSLISRAFPDLWPGGAEISFCLTIYHCRTILYYTVLYQDSASKRRYCRLFTLLFRPGGLTGSQTLTDNIISFKIFILVYYLDCL